MPFCMAAASFYVHFYGTVSFDINLLIIASHKEVYTLYLYYWYAYVCATFLYVTAW